MLTAVDTVWNTKAEVEVEGFQMSIPKEMPLNHSELVDGLPAHLELHRGSHGPQLEELEDGIYYLLGADSVSHLRGELVSNKSPGVDVLCLSLLLRSF